MNGAGRPAGAPIRVLIAEDSPVARELLVHLLSGDPQLQVVGLANDGVEAVAAARRLCPDVVLMDIHLPRLDGFAATRQIMETCPTRIVMASATTDPHEVAAIFRAIEAGALTILAKPVGPGHPGFAAAAAELVRTLKLMAEVQVVRRWPHRNEARPPLAAVPAVPRLALVAIGASTGGPLALQAILSRLAKDFPLPIVIVQHIAESFVAGFAEWLQKSTGYAVEVATAGTTVRPAVAYVAPGGAHLQVTARGTIELVAGLHENGVRPAASALFRSVAAAYGPAAVGILLTGMGRDGAQELKAMRDAGAVTIAQDRESSVVFGMPGEAIALEAASYVLPPEKIAGVLAKLLAPQQPHHE